MTKTIAMIIGVLALGLWPFSVRAQDDVTYVGGEKANGFNIVIQRDSLVNGTMYGTISVKNTVLGTTYENPDKMIAADVYNGSMRYYSPTAKSGGHVQGPLGVIGRTGDFLLEIVNARADDDGHPKTNVLLHGGVKPSNSEGCIMLGPVHRTKAGVRYLQDSDPLRQLRLMFYNGVDDPVQSPNKDIKFEIRGLP